MWIKRAGCEETEEHICDKRRMPTPLRVLKHDLFIYLLDEETGTRYDQTIIRACPFCGEQFADYY